MLKLMSGPQPGNEVSVLFYDESDRLAVLFVAQDNGDDICSIKIVWVPTKRRELCDAGHISLRDVTFT